MYFFFFLGYVNLLLLIYVFVCVCVYCMYAAIIVCLFDRATRTLWRDARARETEL